MKYFLVNLIILINFIIIISIGWFIFDIFSAHDTIGESNAKSPNIILVVVDTLRADYLSCYGNDFVKTPNIDKLASDGVLFENVIAQSSWTLPSHATLMTSKYPIQHGALSYNNPMNESEVTLAETLKTNGYTTCAFISTVLVSSKFGFNQGFDTFDETLDSDYERPVTEFHKKSLKWVNRNYKRKFFLWMHYFEPHFPYLPHEPDTSLYESYLNKGKKGMFNHTHEWIKEEFNRSKADLSDKDQNRMKALYGGEVTYIDGFIGELIYKIKAMGLYDKSLIVLISDHGESLGEHHLIEHGESLYEPEIRVPLIIKLPFNNGGIKKGKRVKVRAQLIDVMPTILSALKIKPLAKFYGSDLIPYMRDEGKLKLNDSYSEVHNFKSLTRGESKLILSLPVKGKPELFNLKTDAGEKENLFQSSHEQGKNLRKDLFKWIITMNNPFPNVAKIDIKTEEKLKSLGYLNSGIDRTIKMDRFPPQGKIFGASFRSKIDADYAKGKSTAAYSSLPEIKNEGILVGSNKSISFEADKNVNDKEGTIEFWIRPSWKWNNSRTHHIITITGGPKENLIEIKVLDKINYSKGKTYTGPFLVFNLFTDKWYQSVCDVRNLSNDVPHHIVATWKADGSQVNDAMMLYVDGVRDEFAGKSVKSIRQERKSNLIVLGKGDEKEKDMFMISGLKIYSTYHDWGPLIMDIVKKTVLAE